MIKNIFSIFILLFLIISCSSSTDYNEYIATTEQALRCDMPTGTEFHRFVIQELSVTEECAATHEEFLPYYSTAEPRRWRIDANAPPPKKTNGQSCTWLTPLQAVSETQSCDFYRVFSCNYTGGQLIYHITIKSNNNVWVTPEHKIYIFDPSGNVWEGCVRWGFGSMPTE